MRATLLLTLALFSIACGDNAETAPTEPAAAAAESVSPGTVLRLDPRLDDLLAADATIEKVADGFVFVEGPVWMPDDGGYLLFSDIPANKVYRWSEASGVSTFLDPVLLPELEAGGNGGSNGLNRDPQGRLILCEHGNRRIARMESDGTRRTLADRYDGKRLNSPNDIVFHSSGEAYFTDPPYGLEGQDESPAKELEWNGIYRIRLDGTVDLLADGQSRPNGIGLSPD